MTIEEMVQEYIEKAKAAEAEGNHVEAMRIQAEQFQMVKAYFEAQKNQ